MDAVAIFLRHRERLPDLLRRGQLQTDHAGRQRDLYHGVLADRAAGRRRDTDLHFEQSTVRQALLQLDGTARMDEGYERPFPVLQDEESAGPSDVLGQGGSHGY